MVTSLCLRRVKPASEREFKKLCESCDGRPAMEFPRVEPIEIRFKR